MTTFLLVRHGETDAVGKLVAGWMPGWHLNRNGQKQAERLARKLANRPIAAVYTSPLERTVETAEPIAHAHGLTIRPIDDLGEVHAGDWEGKSFAELQHRDDWRRFNAHRGSARPPGGELMLEVQTRMVRQIQSLAGGHPEHTVVVVTHGDPLRSLVAHYLGIPMDLISRFEISPGSLTTLQISPEDSCLLSLNDTDGMQVIS